MSFFSADDATFIGFIVEGILWGLYIPIFALSIGSLLWSKRTGKATNWFTIIATAILFALCTVHFSLNFSRIYDGLLLHPNPKVPISQQTFTSLLSNVAFTTTDFVAQTVLIYRCWRIYDKNLWVVAFPILLSLGSFATGLTGVIMLLMIVSTGVQELPVVLVSLGISSFTISLGVNVLVTMLILARIYSISTTWRSMNKSTNQNGVGIALEAFIESGALFMLAQLVFVLLFATKNNGQLVGVAIAAQIYGIAPTLLVARVAVEQSMRKTRQIPQFSRSGATTLSSRTGSEEIKVSQWEA